MPLVTFMYFDTFGQYNLLHLCRDNTYNEILNVQVANDSNIVIPIHFTTSSIHLSSVSKFKFPIRPPEPNHVQDKRSTLHIFQDMLGILNDTPKLNFKFYLDLLLNRDSGMPEINTDGVELSS